MSIVCRTQRRWLEWGYASGSHVSGMKLADAAIGNRPLLACTVWTLDLRAKIFPLDCSHQSFAQQSPLAHRSPVAAPGGNRPDTSRLAARTCQ